ncbi:MAG TPA: F0F1 ATP synthase subunit B [Kineosporiaceae bacterium]
MSVTATVLAAEDGGGKSFWETAFPVIPHPGELIFGLIAIGILYYVVARHVVPRLEQVYAERAEAIEGGIKKAEIAQAEAAAALQQYRDELAQARAERARIIQQAAEEAAAVAAEIRQRAQDEAERITTAATQQIQAERQAALVQLRQEVGRLAVDLASRVVGESLEDEARQRRVVDTFLADLESAEATAGQGF